MVSNIVFKGRYNVGVNSQGRLMINGERSSIKEVPFVRYRFNSYSEDDIEFILEQANKFKYSVHLVELELSGDIEEQYRLIKGSLDGKLDVGIYIYVPIDDTDLIDGISEEKLDWIELLGDIEYDRLMIKDKSTSMFLEGANRVKREISEILGINEVDIGICSSPLSFDGNACLTAVKARELMAIYGKSDEVSIPSANHECMNTCGCMRHMVVESDISMPENRGSKSVVVGEGVSKKKKVSSGSKKSKGVKIKVMEW